MQHPLDRPVWSALSTRQQPLAHGNRHAVRVRAEIGLFAAACDGSAKSIAALAALIPSGGTIGTVETATAPAPPGTTIRREAACWQMLAQSIAPGEPAFAHETLTAEDAAEMLALATLTEPGPFFAETHRFGGFIGVRQDGRLVAMAGQRLSMPGFTEVSGVCTHPDHRGHGYAAGLMRIVARRILASGDTPFLHAYATNRAATALYERLGFALRREVVFTILERAGEGCRPLDRPAI